MYFSLKYLYKYLYKKYIYKTNFSIDSLKQKQVHGLGGLFSTASLVFSVDFTEKFWVFLVTWIFVCFCFFWGGC